MERPTSVGGTVVLITVPPGMSTCAAGSVHFSRKRYLVQRAPLGDILTLVQAKRYAPRRKIDQTDVSALYGSGRLEHADKALFVTTSSYAPVARRWAARTEGYLELAEADDVVKWCAHASHGIIRDKASLVSPEHVSRLICERPAN